MLSIQLSLNEAELPTNSVWNASLSTPSIGSVGVKKLKDISQYMTKKGYGERWEIQDPEFVHR